MRRALLVLVNLAVGTAAATAFAFTVGRSADLRSAFLAAGWAGFAVGATVAAGAALGPRPPLSVPRCLLAQAVIALTSAVGAFTGSLLPEDASLDRALADRGVVIGSWVGAAVGTGLGIMQVYRMRRREAPGR